MKKFWQRSPMVLALLIMLALVLALLGQRQQHRYACGVNCMDGRIQQEVINCARQKCDVDYVDMVTEAGPNKILAENTDSAAVANIKKRICVSVEHHGSRVVVLVAHEGCAGNPVDKEQQIQHLRQARQTIQNFGLDVKVKLFWVEPKKRDWLTQICSGNCAEQIWVAEEISD